MNIMNQYNPNQSAQEALVRVLNAIPDSPDLDVYANDLLIASNLAFKELSNYITLPRGDYNISFYVTGTKNEPILSNTITLNDGDKYTVSAEGKMESRGLLAISDNNAPIHMNQALLRFAQLSPKVPPINITLPDGTVLFENVNFKEITPYSVALPPETYTFQIRVNGYPQAVLSIPGLTLEPDHFYTIYSLGLLQGDPDFILAPDGVMEKEQEKGAEK